MLAPAGRAPSEWPSLQGLDNVKVHKVSVVVIWCCVSQWTHLHGAAVLFLAHIPAAATSPTARGPIALAWRRTRHFIFLGNMGEGLELNCGCDAETHKEFSWWGVSLSRE